MKQVSSIAVIFEDGKKQFVLMGKRDDSKKYTLPGGHLEKNEDPVTGCLRELKEEAGLDLKFEDVKYLTSETVDCSDGQTRNIHAFTTTLPYETFQEVTSKNDPDKEVKKWEAIKLGKDNRLPDDVEFNLHSNPNVALRELGITDQPKKTKKGKTVLSDGKDLSLHFNEDKSVTEKDRDIDVWDVITPKGRKGTAIIRTVLSNPKVLAKTQKPLTHKLQFLNLDEDLKKSTPKVLSLLCKKYGHVCTNSDNPEVIGKQVLVKSGVFTRIPPQISLKDGKYLKKQDSQQEPHEWYVYTPKGEKIGNLTVYHEDGKAIVLTRHLTRQIMQDARDALVRFYDTPESDLAAICENKIGRLEKSVMEFFPVAEKDQKLVCLRRIKAIMQSFRKEENELTPAGLLKAFRKKWFHILVHESDYLKTTITAEDAAAYTVDRETLRALAGDVIPQEEFPLEINRLAMVV